MSEHRVVVDWSREGRAFGQDYCRDHTWRFDGGPEVVASSAPELMGDATRADPEQAFVASISSCHMLWFLFLAARDGIVVDSYTDAAVGFMSRDADGVTWIGRVELTPIVEFADAPPSDVVSQLHRDAHRRCFIANSVRSEIVIHDAHVPG